MKFPFFGSSEKKESPKRGASSKKAAVSRAPKQKEEAPASEGHMLTIPAGAHRIIRAPFMSEKASRLTQQNQYVFLITSSATKSEVKKHVGTLFKVKVLSVNIVNLPRKKAGTMRRHFAGVRPQVRKAIVTLAPGQTIGATMVKPQS
ncbi:MAG: 50S ribosomal protein L23 [Patescibacteria group bacterium]